MLFGSPTYEDAPERDADDLYELHRDAEREAATTGVGGMRPPVECRGAGPDGGADGCTSPAAVRSSAGGRGRS